MTTNTCQACEKVKEGVPARCADGEVRWFCHDCLRPVRRADREPEQPKVERGPVRESRMRTLPSGGPMILTTIAIDHRRARRGT